MPTSLPSLLSPRHLSPALVGLSALLSGCVIGGGESSWSFDDPRQIEARLSNGSLSVESSPDTLVMLDWEGGGVGELPEVSAAKQNVLFDADDLLGGGELDIEAPAGVPLILRLDRGEIDVELDHPASIDACVATGELSIRLPPGGYRFELDLAVGAISSDQLWDDPDSPYLIRGCTAVGELSVEIGLAGDDD